MNRKILGAFVGLLLFAGCQRPEVVVIQALPDPVAHPTREADSTGPAISHSKSLSPSETAAMAPEPGWIPPAGLSSRWTCIVIHHSAGDTDTPTSMDRAHRQRGWDELGYHFVVGNGIGYPEGKVFIGSRWTKQKHGAHCKVPGNYYNEHGIGICLIGNFEEHPPSETQMQTLVRLVKFLMKRCGIGLDRIYTHGGITGKTRCPGQYFSLASLLRRLREPFYAVGE